MDEVINLAPLESVQMAYDTNYSDGTVQAIEMAVDFPDGATLEELSDLFRRFVVAAGFGYVTGVTFTTENGGTITAP